MFARPLSRRLVRLILLVVAAAVLAWLGYAWARESSYDDFQRRCTALEQARSWNRLLNAARQWGEHSPGDRGPLIAGTRAAIGLNNPRLAAEFLEQFPRERAGDVEWLSMLADLQFGPLARPSAGARTCEDILSIDSQHIQSYRRLVYFNAMMHQHSALISIVRRATEQDADSAEFHVYVFLADALHLSNAPAQTWEWFTRSPSDMSLAIAHALHVGRGLEGSAPSSEEVSSESVRQARAERDKRLDLLLADNPRHTELLAWHLERAIDRGETKRVAELLQSARVEADADDRFWRARGWLFLQLGELREADTALAEALARNRLSWRTWFRLADLRRRQSNMTEAEVLERRAQTGRSIESELQSQPDVRAVDARILVRLADFAEDCGEGEVARRLRGQAIDGHLSTQPAARGR